MSKTNPFTDNELMLCVRDGDNAMLGRLFDRNNKQLFNFFLYSTGKRQIAEDLVQDVFIRMLKYAHTFRGEGFTSWMFSIARNARAEYFRKRQVMPLADYEDEQSHRDDETPAPEDHLIQDESVELLHAAMKQLPIEKRELLLMTRFHLLKIEEIAEILDCPIGTVKARIHRAIKELALIYNQRTPGTTT